MPANNAIWSGPIGSSGYTLCIEPIGSNMNRGLLVVEDSEGEAVYQKEVPINRRLPGGGTPDNVRAWQNVVNTWINNIS